MPSVGARTMNDAVSVSPASDETVTTVVGVDPESGSAETVNVDLRVELNN